MAASKVGWSSCCMSNVKHGTLARVDSTSFEK